jgi:hypothetical protein
MARILAEVDVLMPDDRIHFGDKKNQHDFNAVQAFAFSLL